MVYKNLGKLLLITQTDSSGSLSNFRSFGKVICPSFFPIVPRLLNVYGLRMSQHPIAPCWTSVKNCTEFLLIPDVDDCPFLPRLPIGLKAFARPKFCHMVSFLNTDVGTANSLKIYKFYMLYKLILWLIIKKKSVLGSWESPQGDYNSRQNLKRHLNT